MKVAAVFLSAFCAAALGIPLGQDVVHEKRTANSKLVKGAAIKADTVVPVRIALKQKNLDQGMKLLMDVSDPDSPNYGNHYTAEQVAELFAPERGSLDAVQKWLAASGVKGATVPKSKGWVDFSMTVDKLESLLKTTYHSYDHLPSGESHMGSDGYTLPSEIAKHVDFITPGVVTTQMVAAAKPKGDVKPGRPVPIIPVEPSMVAKLSQPEYATSNCSQYMTPECIKAMYGITEGTLKDPSNKMGMFESQDEMHQQSDLNQFYKKFAPKIPNGFGPKIDLIDWGNTKPDPSQAVGEAALDFDVSYPIIYPQNIELYQTNANFDGRSHLGFFNQFLDAVDGPYCTSSSHGETGDDPEVDGTTPNEQCGDFKPANVISFSYGLPESLYPANYLERQCDEFMKLSLQGTTIVFSSGDGGVAGGHGGDCLGDNYDIFNPSMPASCPYVTSVGSTKLPVGSSPGDEEVATSRFASGGGFSNIWATPDYQKSAVDAFFASHDPGFESYNTTDGKVPDDSGVFNRAGRAFPDIAAIGDYGVIVFDGSVSRTGGTSMSAPIAASMFNRVNEERIKAGKKSIGFANPALYKNPKMFNDITSGDQSGGQGQCRGKGFKAVSGWDPVTGLGTPKYADLLEYFKSL